MAESLQYKVLNMEGKEVGSVDLDPAVFGGKIDKHIVHAAVRWQRAKARAGTHSTLTRAEVSGGGKKPWKQKGTGRARAGSNTSPVWVGGGVTFGPKPRSYEFRFPKQNRKQALISVLSEKVKSGNLVILDKLSSTDGKTKGMAGVLSKLGLKDTKVTLVMPTKDASVWRASSNIKKVHTLPVSGVNVYDLVNGKVLLCTKDGIAALQKRIVGEASN